jgi:hypothetical protein
MADTKRYEVGPEQGFAQATVMKLTEEQAKAIGATKVSTLKTTADDLAKRDSYEEAMTSQERMRAAEAAAEPEPVVAAEPAPVEEAPVEEAPVEAPAEPEPAAGKARPAPKK